MEPTSIKWPVEQIILFQEVMECFKQCYWLRLNIFGEHTLVREAECALEDVMEVLFGLEELYEGIGGAPAA